MHLKQKQIVSSESYLRLDGLDLIETLQTSGLRPAQMKQTNIKTAEINNTMINNYILDTVYQS